eukprot:TRINITY_DN41053_c0_g1_i1.p1 TRINITY_DN41053_c0_g1~~TRINITY_DN41053_c0_g1_i1.p1  ORF type:complete len:602 (+),score=108.21 TRINITY_DN41053_c0_g1_i1:201-1808(+)
MTGESIIIPDAYQDPRFNTGIDLKTGFKTHDILCVPVRASKARIIGVSQLINKTAGGVISQGSSFPPGGRHGFTIDDAHFFEVLAAQAGSAIVANGLIHHNPSALAQEQMKMLSQTDDGISSPSRDGAGSPVGRSFSNSKSGIKSTKLPYLVVKTPSNFGALYVAESDDDAQGTGTCSSAIAALQKARKVATLPILKAACTSWETDTLLLDELSDNSPMAALTYHLIEHCDLIDTFNLDEEKLKTFLAQIEVGYPNKNDYHNRAHGASVVHFMYALLRLGGLAKTLSRAAEALEEDLRAKFVMLIGLLAAVVHDFEHDGVTNDYHKKSMSQKAILYNNVNVNEQHHAAAAFNVLLKPECNFLASMPREQFQLLRTLICELVLATDMADHGKILDAYKASSMVTGAADRRPGVCAVPDSAQDATLALKIALKCADLGHIALSWGAHNRWVRRLEEEFFRQGDGEKMNGYPVSFLMDRDKPGVTQTQTGFFDFLVKPLFRSFVAAFPTVAPMSEAVETNALLWAEVQDKLQPNTAGT